LRTIALKAEYDRLKASHSDPSALLAALNESLIRLFPQQEILCTACCFDVELLPDGARVHYANAAHVPVLHLRDGKQESIHADSPFLGASKTNWQAAIVVDMRPGETLLAMTDGILEQTNSVREMFESAVLPALDISRCASAAETVTSVIEALHSFRGSSPGSDDLLLLAIRLV
jgi:serine phosphatase RsbU (regulator of sigma subunit)